MSNSTPSILLVHNPVVFVNIAPVTLSRFVDSFVFVVAPTVVSLSNPSLVVVLVPIILVLYNPPFHTFSAVAWNLLDTPVPMSAALEKNFLPKERFIKLLLELNAY